MRIRIEGTEAEVAYALNKIRDLLPIKTVTPLIRVHRRPHTWQVHLNTAPASEISGWAA